ARYDPQRRATADRGGPGDVRGAGRRRAAHVRAGAGATDGAALLSILMRGPEMAPHTPPSAPRSSRGLDRTSNPEPARDTAPGAPRSSRGLDRTSNPEPARDTAPGAPRSSRGLDRTGDPELARDTAPGAPRSSPGLDRTSDAGRGHDRDGGSAVPIITEPHVHVDDTELVGLERDVLALTAEERRWGRRRVTTRAGRTLALALPTGSVLIPGDVLHVGPGWYVAVEAAPEPV